MPWPCFKVASIRRVHDGGGSHCLYTLPDGREVGFGDLPPGAMWHSTEVPTHDGNPDSRIPSICVVLPGKAIWRMADPSTSGGNGWTVTGEIPNVSASPSINFVGLYHGHVQNGVVTDDVDGRKFTPLGERA